MTPSGTPVTSPQAVAFCNEQVRPAADRAVGLFARITTLLLQWNAISATIPNDPTVVIDDGSASDGRVPITGADVWTFIGGLQTFATQIQANSQALLLNAGKIAVNPQQFE